MASLWVQAIDVLNLGIFVEDDVVYFIFLKYFGPFKGVEEVEHVDERQILELSFFLVTSDPSGL